MVGLAAVCLTVAACSDDSTADNNGDAGDRAQEPNRPGEPEPAPSNAAEPEPQAPNNPGGNTDAGSSPKGAQSDAGSNDAPSDAGSQTQSEPDASSPPLDDDGGTEPHVGIDAGDATAPQTEDSGTPSADGGGPGDPCAAGVAALCGAFATACQPDGSDYVCRCDADHSLDEDAHGCHARSFGDATRLDTQNASSPSLTASANGEAWVAFLQNDGIRDHVYASHFDHRDGFSTPVQLENADAPTTGWPSIAMNDNGDGLVVYQQWSGTRDRIWAVPFSASNGFGNPTLAEASTSGSAQAPSVAVDDAGNAVLVWQQTSDGRTDIWATRFTPQGGFAAAQLVETSNNGSAHGPHVAIDGAGNALVVWDQSDGTNRHAYAARYQVGTGWAAPVQLSEPAQGAARNAIVAGDGSGIFQVLWEQKLNGASTNLLARRYASGNFALSSLLNSSTAGDVHNAHVAVSASGTAIATWAQSDGSGDRIYTNVWNTSWQGQTRIDTGDGASSPHVALNSNGVGLAVWGQRVADELGVWASHWQNGWSSPESLEQIAGTAYGPASTLFANGEAVVAFEVFQSVDNDHVYGLSFD